MNEEQLKGETDRVESVDHMPEERHVDRRQKCAGCTGDIADGDVVEFKS